MSSAVDPQCRAYQRAIGILSGPWTGLVLAVLQATPLRFSEIEEKAAGVGSKTLSLRLKVLTKAGVIERLVDDGPPVRVQYGLTQKGRAFGKVAMSIERWGRTLIADEARTAGGARKRRAPRRSTG